MYPHQAYSSDTRNITPDPERQWTNLPPPPPPSFSSPFSVPKTPEPIMSNPLELHTPNAPREPVAKFRVRRRRTTVNTSSAVDNMQTQIHLQDIPVPSIELSYAHSNNGSISARSQDLHMLSPALATGDQAFFSPPKTPVSQIVTSFSSLNDSHWSLSQANNEHKLLDRPTSSLSVFSDSSMSSSCSSRSNSESATSPESDIADPFYFPGLCDTAADQPEGLLSPVTLQPYKSRKRLKTSHRPKWTQDMDDHLWMTYLAYQTHPEMTPFKALPGALPPTGVGHRVAREAKRTWRGPRLSLHPITEENQAFRSIDTIMRENSAPVQTTPKADSPAVLSPPPRSHSSQEVSRKSFVSWPRSEASTRKRLRQLCKSKPNLPPHYQRLLQTRSPSPFGSSSSAHRSRTARPSSSPKDRKVESSFSTSDLKLSLTAHTLSSMQPGNLLSQLANDGPTPARRFSTWSTPSGSRGVHQKSQSLQAELGMSARARGKGPLTLASPFHQTLEDPNESSSSTAMPQLGLPPLMSGEPNSPWMIHAPRPMSGSMKRRAEYPLGEEMVSNDHQTRAEFLHDLFKENLTDGHRRVRSRGFSLGAMRQPQQTRQLSELFAVPPITADEEHTNMNVTMGGGAVPSHGHNLRRSRLGLLPPTTFPPPRLRSPFMPATNTGISNTFPRTLLPHGLDSITTQEETPRATNDDVFGPVTPSTSHRGFNQDMS